MLEIAVIITFHNRCQKTLACLTALYNQSLPEGYRLFVYAVDDGSTDSTVSRIRENYSSVKLFCGDGNLFWNGGMNRAWNEAVIKNYDYYLWLNDDTILYSNSIRTIIDVYFSVQNQTQQEPIIVGSTQDPSTLKLTYGGVGYRNRWHPLDFRNIEPTDKPIKCDTMNGNCVLISKSIVQKIGLLDSQFIHAFGDFDYGLRATQGGYSVYIAPGYVGTCVLNKSKGTWQDETLSLSNRLKMMAQPKGMPWKEWRYFAQRYGGYFWFIFFLLPYLKVVISSIFWKVTKITETDKSTSKETSH